MSSLSHPEPKRKTNQYPGGHLPDDAVIDNVLRKQRDEPVRTDGNRAVSESVRYALNGIEHTNQISCLRGPLRKAVITLAQEIRASKELHVEPAEGEQRKH